jgi:bacterioferritin-associated ferredoxin
MYVCHCKAVTDRTVDAVIVSGAKSVAEITARCAAGGECGGCHRLLQRLLDATALVAVGETAGASAA